MIDLNEQQLQDIIENVLNKEHGLNDLLERILNGLMKMERTHWITHQSEPGNKANGFRPGRALGFGKKLALHIPRDRLGAFKPVLWALLRDQHQEVRQLCFELYGKGLTTRQVGQITQRIYGQSYSSSAISGFTQELASHIHQWRDRPLAKRYPIILIDAIHAKVRRGHVSSEAFYVVLALTEDMQREVLAIESIPSESAAGWQHLLESLKKRGLEHTELIIADALSGLDQVVGKVFTNARHQKCVTHLKRSILTKVKTSDRSQIAEQLREVFVTGSREYTCSKGLENFKRFANRWNNQYPFLKRIASSYHIEYYFTYLDFDWRIQSMIYTTNWIERLNKSFRRSLKIRNALPSSESAILLMSKVAMDIEEATYQYPIYNFKFDRILFPR